MKELSLSGSEEPAIAKSKKSGAEAVVRVVKDLVAEECGIALLKTMPNLEAETGDFGMVSIFRETVSNPKNPLLNHAEFIGPVEKRWISDQKGFGLLATRDVEPGELLIASKAFSVVFVPFSKVYDLPSNKETDEFIENTIARISCGEHYAKEFYGLYAGESYPRNESIPVKVDRNHIAQVLHYNGCEFSVRDKPTGDRYSYRGRGLWMLPSFINHSCAPNCTRYCFGDFIFVRAQKKISKGEELTLSYVRWTDDYETRQRDLLSGYGIQCACPLCECDKQYIGESSLLNRYNATLVQYLDAGWYNRSGFANHYEWRELAGEKSGSTGFVAAPNVYALRYCAVALSDLQREGKANSSEAKDFAEKLLKCAEIEYGARQALDMFLLMSPSETSKTAVELTRKLLGESS